MKPDGISDSIKPLKIDTGNPQFHQSGTVEVMGSFLFLTEKSGELPKFGFFLPLAEYKTPIAKAILIEADKNSGPCRFTLGLLRTSSTQDYSQVHINRYWARHLWTKCGLPQGSRAFFGAKLDESGADFTPCNPREWFQIEPEETMFLVIGMLWGFWRVANDLKYDYCATEIVGLALQKKKFNGNRLWKFCKWAGLIPLTDKEQKQIEARLKDPESVLREIFIESEGAEAGKYFNQPLSDLNAPRYNVRLGSLFLDTFLRDYLTEKLLKRKIRPSEASIAEAKLRREAF